MPADEMEAPVFVKGTAPSSVDFLAVRTRSSLVGYPADAVLDRIKAGRDELAGTRQGRMHRHAGPAHPLGKTGSVSVQWWLPGTAPRHWQECAHGR